jgi:cytochrome c nitrite reductase small subunit
MKISQIKWLINMILPPAQWKVPVFLSIGIIGGMVIYLVYVSRAGSYLSDDPKTCVNCHVMSPFYATWFHSSHRNVATCNDCHVPHNNVFNKYFFKAKDGLYHSTIFTMGAEPQVIRIHEAGTNVVMANCQRCHYGLNENVKTTDIKLIDRNHGKGKLCWDCHREVPHGRATSLSSTPNAMVPRPKSPVPDWLKKQMRK